MAREYRIRNTTIRMDSDGAAPCEIWAGAGAPSFTPGTAVALYIRNNASSPDGTLYLTRDTGSNWFAVESASGGQIIPDGSTLDLGTGSDFTLGFDGTNVEFFGADVADGASAPLYIDTGDATSVTGANATGLFDFATGASTANANNRGDSGAITLTTGASDVTSAHTGGDSGATVVATGDTDSNDAGGTGGASGGVTVQTGDAASTAGTSGNTGNILIKTGASDDGDSGSIVLRPGAAASGSTGDITLQDPADNTKQVLFDLGDLASGETVDANAMGLLQRVVVTIPAGNGAGNAGDLNSTPVELVAAPGAGVYIDVDSIHWFLDYVSAAYDGTKTGNLMAKFTDGSGDEVAGQVAETGFMDQTADVHALVKGVDYVPVANAAIVAHADNDWYSAAGDSPVIAEVLYRVRPLAIS